MQMTNSKTNISTQLVLSEEQKLQIHKELIDLQIETNCLREQYETESFELKCEILTLESRVRELELTGEKAGHERAGLAEQLKLLEGKCQEQSDAYISLENNYQTLAKQPEVLRSEELSLELFTTSKKKHPLPAQPKPPSSSQPSEFGVAAGIAAKPVRIRPLAQGFTHQKLKTEDIVASEREQKKMEKKLLASQEYIQEEMEKMKLLQKTHQEKLEEKVAVLGKELQDAKQEIRSTQHKMDEQTLALLASQKQLQEVERENSRLQQQLKMMNEEYRTRLLHYVKKMASYIDNTTQGHQGSQQTDVAEAGAMKKLLDGMLNDMQASNRSREQQLAKVARNYKKRMESLMKSHESLLNAYRVLREQIKAQGGPNMEPGPSEAHFAINEDLPSNLTQELNKLREDKAQLETQIQELQAKNGSNKASDLGASLPWDKVVWTKIQKQLQEFTQNTQSELEKERSHLWSRALVAEEQLSQLQEYVDKHLGRYKQEILRLRKLLGNECS
ncbi:coiled-coil domain-containing protein 78 isoform X2 [Notamacropus eugenii]|uniref:coiled-coil domain-containing protein 78 isoform X2 n=1 Tax=Notamacropus eugenii TaxID=9315 RepID=UPI003B66FCAA